MDNELRALIYEQLAGGPWQVFDYVPADTDYPYITIGDSEAVDVGMIGTALENNFTTITCWSEYLGASEVMDMMQYIAGKLHRVRLQTSGGTKVSLWVRNRRASREIEDDTYMGNVTVEILAQP